MNTLYPDATAEELAAADNVCIICREEMQAGNEAFECTYMCRVLQCEFSVFSLHIILVERNMKILCTLTAYYFIHRKLGAHEVYEEILMEKFSYIFFFI